jgi:hypothetical protein
MSAMSKPHYFTFRFRGFAVGNDPESGYLRLITRHHTFYTDKRFFKDDSGFDQLPARQSNLPWNPPFKRWQLLD